MIEIQVLGNEETAGWLSRKRKNLATAGLRCQFSDMDSATRVTNAPDIWLIDLDACGERSLAQVLEKINRMSASSAIPVLITGKRISLGLAREAVLGGARRFLDKPLTPRTLANACRELGVSSTLTAKTAIVLEDRSEVLEKICQPLAEQSINALPARSVEDALNLARNNDCDVIVVSHNRDSLSYHEVSALFGFFPESSSIPLIFITENIADNEAKDCLNLIGTQSFCSSYRKLGQYILEQTGKHTTRKLSGGRIYDILYEREQEHLALNHHAIVTTTDNKGRITEVNRQFCELSQYSENELLGQNHRILKSGRHSPDFYRDLWKTISGGDVWQGEICNQAKDGTHYWVSSTIVPFLDNKKRPYKYMAIRKNITHVKASERQVELQGQLAKLVSEVSAGILSGHWSDAPLTLLTSLHPLSEFLEISHVSIKVHRADHILATWRRFTTDARTGPTISISDASETAPLKGGSGHRLETALRANGTEIGYLALYAKDSRRTEIFSDHGLVNILGNVISQALTRWVSEFQQERSRERLRRAQSFANIGTWEWNLETDDLFWTERVPMLFGYPEGDLETSFENFVAAIHPDDRDRVQSAIQASIEHDAPYQIEHRIIWPDGAVRWLLETGAVVRGQNGAAQQMLGVVEDITAMQETKQQLARQTALLNMLHDSLTTFVLEGKFRATLDSMLNSLLDLTDSEFGLLAEVFFTAEEAPFLKVQSITDISWNPESAEMYSRIGTQNFELHDLDNMLGASIRQREIVTVSEYQADEVFIGLPQGHPKVQTLLNVPIFIGSDLVGAFVLANRPSGYDTTIVEFLRPFMATYGVIINSQRMLDMEEVNRKSLVRAKLRADQANRAKSEFLSKMSHELRTPLNAIQGFGQLLENDSKLSEDQQDSISEILSASKHLLALINEVLDLARIESGKLELSFESLPVGSVIHEALTLVRHSAEKQGLTITTRDIEHYHVTADWTRLKQAVLNLLSNAVKYNRLNGSIEIEARLYEESLVEIRISDTGHGIPESRIPDLFQPFNRLGAELGHIEGTGIGLSLTRQLVELMGGSIGVISTVGKGSTFWIRLPAEERGTCTNGSPTLHSNATLDNSEKNLHAGKCTILYIEDNPANLKLVERIINREPRFILVSATTASEGLRLASTSTPDLVLVDINLPDMDGYSLLGELRSFAHLSRKPMLALTANAMSDDMQRGRNAGFDDYLTKPINIDELMNTIRKHLG
ncbi:MAG: PAS domain-containing protein [Pseudomonadota bacterium]|nr:PAS domain-containing protein [Pseudomonadota bacterium]